jgi:hypothetical protein
MLGVWCGGSIRTVDPYTYTYIYIHTYINTYIHTWIAGKASMALMHSCRVLLEAACTTARSFTDRNFNTFTRTSLLRLFQSHTSVPIALIGSVTYGPEGTPKGCAVINEGTLLGTGTAEGTLIDAGNNAGIESSSASAIARFRGGWGE